MPEQSLPAIAARRENAKTRGACRDLLISHGLCGRNGQDVCPTETEAPGPHTEHLTSCSPAQLQSSTRRLLIQSHLTIASNRQPGSPTHRGVRLTSWPPAIATIA